MRKFSTTLSANLLIVGQLTRKMRCSVKAVFRNVAISRGVYNDKNKNLFDLGNCIDSVVGRSVDVYLVCATCISRQR